MTIIISVLYVENKHKVFESRRLIFEAKKARTK